MTDKERADQAEADRDVLAAEVRAWRAADKYHHLRMHMQECWASTHRNDVEKAMDASNDGALDRAKEAKR